jgi:hypothetical protein
MALDDGGKREYSAEELAVLSGVIDYADRMIYEDKHLNVLGGMADSYGYVSSTQAPGYRLLRKHAFAKTVVIETELQGRLMLRLSPSEVIYPNVSSGYCTPHSPQGRLSSFVQPGYESRSKLWGDYRVVEVRSFERFGGPEFEPNVRNFLRMGVGGDAGAGTVSDLRGFLDRFRKPGVIPEVPTAVVQDAEAHAQALPEEPPTPEPQPVAEVPIVEFIISDEPDQEKLETVEESDEEWNPDSPPVNLQEYYGLSERFFTHQTTEQNQIITRTPLGPMFVEGVAGSGKTSAALGRTKMLSSFSATSAGDEKTFRDVLGDGQDYWSPEYAGQFSQQSCVGFVRTGELIQYLQETCRRIDLPDLQVHEFKELQSRLRAFRKITYSPLPGRRWTGLTESRVTNDATTMAWLRSTDQAMARRLAEVLLETLPASTDFEEAFVVADRPKALRVMTPALELLRVQLSELSDELRTPPREGTFSLDRLALRLLNALSEVRKRVMGSKVVWTQINGQTLFASDENNLARQLVDRKAALYLSTSQRLIFVDGNGPIDTSLQLRSTSGDVVTWGEDTRALLASGQVIVRDASGAHVRGIASDVGHLFLRLLPEATDRIYVIANGALKRLTVDRGWGRVKLQLLPVETSKLEEEEVDDDADLAIDQPAPGQPRHSTPDAVFTRLVRRRLLRPLTALADLYLDVLKSGAKHFPAPAQAQQIQRQLERFKLADEDVDLLLCLGHLLSRGVSKAAFKAVPDALCEASFYQAVFIDEVQDFTEHQVYLMVEQANPRYRAITVVGDLAQKLHHGSSIDLQACFPGPAVATVKLTENLRQSDTPGLALFSALFRTQFHGDASPAEALKVKVRASGVALVRPKVDICPQIPDLDNAIVEALRAAKRHQTVAVLFPNADTASSTFKRIEPRLREHMIDAELSEKVNLARRHVRHFADVTNAKGLEFDVVILVNVDAYDLTKAAQVNRLYVGITRARCALTLLSRKQALPTQLSLLINTFESLCNGN